MTIDPKICLEPHPDAAEIASERTEQRDAFQVNGRVAQGNLDQTGVTFSIEEVSACRTAKIEAKRAQLLKQHSAGY